MIGGTNGAHLTSFSLVDVLSHGRACAMMNPYYTVFFGPAIQPQLRLLGKIYEKYGFMTTKISPAWRAESWPSPWRRAWTIWPDVSAFPPR